MNEYSEGRFNLNTAVTTILKKHNANKAACLEELSAEKAKVQKKMQQVAHMNYKRFIDTSLEVQKSAHELLRMREEVRTFRAILQQVADLPLSFSEDYTDTSTTDPTGLDLAVKSSSSAPEAAKALQYEVELAIFEHDFGKAVNLIQTSEAVSERDLWQIEEFVVSQLQLALRTTPAASRPLLKHLITLGRRSEAIDIFFSHRNRWIQREVRRVRFVGDIVVYAKAAANAVFRGLSATHTEFTELFSEKQRVLSPVGKRSGPSSFGGPTGATTSRKVFKMSAAVKWIIEEIISFSATLRPQVFGAELFSDIFRALAEVFKACRDHLEPRGLDVLWYLQNTVEEPALKALDKESGAVEGSVLRALDDDNFTPGLDENISDLQAPPLWGRTSRGERIHVVLSPSAKVLLERIASLLHTIRTVSSDGGPLEGHPRSTDRPWPALEETADKAVANIVREYLKAIFDRAKEEWSEYQITIIISNVSFIVLHLLKRISEVLRSIFHRERVNAVDNLRLKTDSMLVRMLGNLAESWRDYVLEQAAEEVAALVLDSDSEGWCILNCVKQLICSLAGIHLHASELLSEVYSKDVVFGHFVQKVVEKLHHADWWMGLLQSQDGDMPSVLRNISITNASLVKRAVFGYDDDKLWSEFQAALAVTPEDLDRSDEAFLSDTDHNLAEAITELDKSVPAPAEE